MESLLSNGIRVSVYARYQAAYSRPTEEQYVFSYHIVIENCREDTVQLLYRHWVITNGMGEIQEVEGDGVIGQQPVLEPGDVHSYDSWCPLASPLGSMEGRYLMVSAETGEEFYAQVPRFQLESTVVMN
jgi:ApaG protein